MILKELAIILVIIFLTYIFYKCISEKNKIKISFPLMVLLIISIIKMKNQILGILGLGLVLLYFLVIGFLPYIICIIISVIAIFIIKKKTTGEKREKLYTVVIVVCICISTILAPLWIKYASARPDDTYIKIKEIDDNKSLIGLSKEQVVILLGERRTIKI